MKTSDLPPPELNILRALCRQPQLRVNLSRDIIHDMTPGGLAENVIRLMLVDFPKRNIPVSLQSLSETGIEYGDLSTLARECTATHLGDFPANVVLVQKYGAKRRFEKWLEETYNQSIKTQAVKIDSLIQDVSATFNKINTIGVEEGSLYLEDIVDEYLSQDVEKTSWQIPTGITWIDRLLKGGPSKNDLGIIYGKFKDGKTQLMRGIIDNVSYYLHTEDQGHKVIHIAHDGGNKYKHAMYYLAMRIQRELMEQNLPIFGHGQNRDGKYGKVPLISPYTVELVHRNRYKDHELTDLLTFKMPDDVLAMIYDHIERMKSAQQRNLKIYDAKVIRHDLDRMIAIFEREYAEGARFFAIDHAGELGDPSGTEIWKRTNVAAQVVTNFAREHDCIIMVLSQISQSGINDQESSNPHLAGGNEWVIKADWAFRTNLVGAAPNKRMKITATIGRFVESGNDVSTELVPFLASGLIAEDEERQVDMPNDPNNR